MSAVTKANIANTVWPTRGVSEPVKNVISLLLQLLDDKSDDAGPRLADEVFTNDGHLGAAHKAAKGSAGADFFQITALFLSLRPSLSFYQSHVISRVTQIWGFQVLILTMYRNPRSSPQCL